MTTSGRRAWKLLVRLWKGLNSNIVIAILSSFVVFFMTKSYEARQARSADLAKRRSEVERLLVELDLRRDRLQIVCLQATDPKGFTAKQLDNIGRRAQAIVDGRANTVTSDPAFQNFHLASLLSQAEVTAGLPLAHRPELTKFTDRKPQNAREWTPYVLDEIIDPIQTLETGLASGRFPIAQDEDQPRTSAPVAGKGNAAGAAAKPTRDPLLCGAPPRS